MAGTSLGELSVQVIADISALISGLDRAVGAIQSFQTRAVSAGQKFGTTVTGMGQKAGTSAKFMGAEYDKYLLKVKQGATAITGSQDKIVGALNRVIQAIQKLNVSQTKQKTLVQDVNKVVEKSGTIWGKLKNWFMQTGKSVEQTGKQIGTTTNQTKKFADTSSGMITRMKDWIHFNIAWFATWRLMWAALAAIKAGISGVIEFDTALVNLGAITAATQSEIKGLEETARDLGRTTKFTAVEVVTAMVDIGKAGFSVAETNDMIQGTTLLAIASLSDLGISTSLTTTALRTFHKQASDSSEIANIFAAAITNSRLTIDSLKDSMKFAAPIAAELGISVEEITATLGVLADRGIEAGIASRGLRGLMIALIAPTGKLRGELERVNLTVSDVSPLLNSLTTILTNLTEAGFDVESALKGFERRVGTTATALLGAGVPALENMILAMTDTHSAEVMAREQMESLGFRMVELKSKAMDLALSLGRGGVSSAAKGLIDFLGNLIDTINRLVIVIGDVTKEGAGFYIKIVAIGIAAVAAAVQLGIFAKAVKAVRWQIEMSSGPVGWILLAIEAIITVVAILTIKNTFWGKSIEDVRESLEKETFSLNKETTALRTALGEIEKYSDDQDKVRSILEGLIDKYPELLVYYNQETINVDDVTTALGNLIEAKEKEARVTREKTIEAIKEEIEYWKKEKEQWIELEERFTKGVPLVIRMWRSIIGIFSGGAKSLEEIEAGYEKAVKMLEEYTKEEVSATKEEQRTLEILSKTAKERWELEIAEGKRHLSTLDAVIEEEKEWLRIKEADLAATEAAIKLAREQGKSIEGLAEIREEQFDEIFKAEQSLAKFQKIKADYLEKLNSLDEKRKKAVADMTLTEVENAKLFVDLTTAKLDALKKLDVLQEGLTMEQTELQKKTYIELITASGKYIDEIIKNNIARGKSEKETTEDVVIFWKEIAKYIPELSNITDATWVKITKITGQGLASQMVLYEGADKETVALFEKTRNEIKTAYIKANAELYKARVVEIDKETAKQEDSLKKRITNEELLNEKLIEIGIFGLKGKIAAAKFYNQEYWELELERNEKERELTEARYAIDVKELGDNLQKKINAVNEEVAAGKKSTDKGNEEIEKLNAQFYEDLIKLAKEAGLEFSKLDIERLELKLKTAANERNLENARFAYQRLTGEKTLEDEIERLETRLKTVKLTEEEEIAILIEIFNLKKDLRNRDIALDDARFAYGRLTGEKTLEDEISRTEKLLDDATLSKEARVALETALYNLRKSLTDKNIALDDARFAYGRLTGEKTLEDEISRTEKLLDDATLSKEARVALETALYNLRKSLTDKNIALDDARFDYGRLTGEKTLEDEIARTEKLLENKELSKEARVALETALYNLRKSLTNKNIALDDARFAYERELGLKSLDEEIERQIEIVNKTKENTTERINAQSALYSLISERESQILKELDKREATNEEKVAAIYNLWVKYYKDLFSTIEEFEKWYLEHIKDLESETKSFLQRLNEAVTAAFIKIKSELTDIEGFVYNFFKRITDALTTALSQWLTGYKEYNEKKKELDEEYDENRRELEEDYQEDLEEALERFEERLADFRERREKAEKKYWEDRKKLEKKKLEDLERLQERYEKDLTELREDRLKEEERYRKKIEDLEEDHQEKMRKIMEGYFDDARDLMDEMFDWRRVREWDEARTAEELNTLIYNLQHENLENLDEEETRLHDDRLAKLLELRDGTKKQLEEEVEDYEEAKAAEEKRHHEAMESIAKDLKELVKDFKKSYSDILKDFLKNLKELEDSHKETIDELKDEIKELREEYEERLEEMREEFDERMKEMEDRYREMLDDLRSESSQFQTFWGKLWADLGQKVVDAIAAMGIDALITNLGTVLTWIGYLALAVAGLLIQFLGFKWFTDWLEGTGIKIREIGDWFDSWTGPLEGIGDALHDAFDWVADTIADAVEQGRMFLGLLPQWVKDLLGIKTTTEEATSYFAKAWEDLKTKVEEIWGSIVDAVSGAFKRMTETFIKPVYNAFATVINKVIDTIDSIPFITIKYRVPYMEKGGEVKGYERGSEVKGYEKGGEIEKRNGLVDSILQKFQKGGEVLVRAHKGEYIIPESMTRMIKRTGEFPESLLGGIRKGEPPSYQVGGEISGSGNGNGHGAQTIYLRAVANFFGDINMEANLDEMSERFGEKIKDKLAGGS